MAINPFIFRRLHAGKNDGKSGFRLFPAALFFAFCIAFAVGGGFSGKSGATEERGPASAAAVVLEEGAKATELSASNTITASENSAAAKPPSSAAETQDSGDPVLKKPLRKILSFIQKTKNRIFSKAAELSAGALKDSKNPGDPAGAANSQSGRGALKSAVVSQQQNNEPAGKDRPRRGPSFNQGPSKAKGIILHFHKWPPDQETLDRILETAKAEGLKKSDEFPLFKIIILEWNGLKGNVEALTACFRFLEDNIVSPKLKTCEPNFLKRPNSLKIELPAQPGAVKKGKGNLRTCNIVSSHFPGPHLRNRPRDPALSDYWAQNMIGADLLKEELINTALFKKKEILQQFWISAPIRKNLIEIHGPTTEL